MIETRWWDSLIVYVMYNDGRLEVRLGVFCILVIVVVAWKLGRALLSRSSAE